MAEDSTPPKKPHTVRSHIKKWANQYQVRWSCKDCDEKLIEVNHKDSTVTYFNVQPCKEAQKALRAHKGEMFEVPAAVNATPRYPWPDRPELETANKAQSVESEVSKLKPAVNARRQVMQAPQSMESEVSKLKSDVNAMRQVMQEDLKCEKTSRDADDADDADDSTPSEARKSSWAFTLFTFVLLASGVFVLAGFGEPYGLPSPLSNSSVDKEL